MTPNWLRPIENQNRFELNLIFVWLNECVSVEKILLISQSYNPRMKLFCIQIYILTK